jgi:thiamine biosynthesis lipoprotein
MGNVQVAQMTHRAMGTVMTHQAVGPRAVDGLEAVCREVARIEGLLSRFLPGSEISRVNRSAGMRSERVGSETIEVLSQAVEFARTAPGCFDVTVAPVVDLWHAARASLAPPDAACIERALPLVNHHDLVLDPYGRTAGLRKAGQSIDLGGIGKGYAGDRILDVLRGSGIASAYSNLGGNVVTLGCKPDGSPWQIGIQHPRRANRLIGSVAVANQTVVTSGDYQRCFTDRHGVRHHHILDPRTGYPATSGLISVTIVTQQSTAADPLSTIVFVAGMARGLEILSRCPGSEAILVDADLQVYVTQGLEDRFRADRDVAVMVLDGMKGEERHDRLVDRIGGGGPAGSSGRDRLVAAVQGARGGQEPAAGRRGFRQAARWCLSRRLCRRDAQVAGQRV